MFVLGKRKISASRYIYIYTYVYIYTYTYVYTYTYIYTYIHMNEWGIYKNFRPPHRSPSSHKPDNKFRTEKRPPFKPVAQRQLTNLLRIQRLNILELCFEIYIPLPPPVCTSALHFQICMYVYIYIYVCMYICPDDCHYAMYTQR